MDHPDPAAFFEAKGLTLGFTENTIEEMREVYVVNGVTSEREFARLVKRGSIGPVFANLHHAQDGRMFWPVFGTGQTEAEAAASALERWLYTEGP